MRVELISVQMLLNYMSLDVPHYSSYGMDDRLMPEKNVYTPKTQLEL